MSGGERVFIMVYEGRKPGWKGKSAGRIRKLDPSRKTVNHRVGPVVKGVGEVSRVHRWGLGVKILETKPKNMRAEGVPCRRTAET